MVNFKSFNNLVLDMLEYLKLSQPNLDIKPNSVARDLFVDGQALQVSTLYDALREINASLSIANLVGEDLVNYGANFGLQKKTGAKAVGTVVLTFRSVSTDLSIPSGSVVRSRNSIPFVTVSDVNVLVSQKNSLRATATRLRNSLDTVGITDEYAIEVSVEAQSSGSNGNISKYSIISHNISGVNSVTNLSAFTGGTDLESESDFRSRILSTFAGANVGTSAAYSSAILQLANTIDVYVAESGDVLMTRDGSVVVENSDGSLTVSEPGTGGRVDVYVMGENLQSGTDSFVYSDQSGADDPTHDNNDYILGQTSLTADTSLTLNSRRVSTFSGDNSIPTQPVSNIVSVSGSLSGPNFVEEYLDDSGATKGNYKLEKDTGIAGGSPFGLDKFVWTSNEIELEDDAITKGTYNSLDSLSFTDVTEINTIKQDVQVVNENSTVESTREYIQLKHYPVRSVSRVYNLTTGERYVVLDQTPDDTGEINNTGRIQISGRTLPTVSDVLQVDYVWIYEFNKDIDFDSLSPTDSLNTAQDSVEWGYSNYIRNEALSATLDSYGNLIVPTTYPISRVLNVESNTIESATVQQSDQRLNITMINVVENVKSIVLGDLELYNTYEDDGFFSNKLIVLPTDTLAEVGDVVTVTYNVDDIYNVDGYDSGTAVNNIITLNPDDIVSSGSDVYVNYVTSLSNILPSTNISSLPISGDGYNSFTGIDGYQPILNTFSGSNIESNKRFAPTRLRVITTNTPSSGSFRIVGTTFNRVVGTFTSSMADVIDLTTLIKDNEGLSSTSTLSSNIYIGKIISVEEVTLSSGLVQSVDYEFDMTNYQLYNTNWDTENAIELSSLGKVQLKLSDSTKNTDNPITTGKVLRVEFYYVKESDQEDIFFSTNGTHYSDKIFGYVSSINRLSGFQDSAGTTSGKILINSFNQPNANSLTSVSYSYTAPKTNERITINYEYNKLIVDGSLLLQDKRPVTADVLVKEATQIEVDVEMYIVISSAYENSEASVLQDVSDNLSSALTSSELATTIDASDLISSVYNVEGVDRARIIRFNKNGVTGSKLSLTALGNEYFVPGDISVTVETR